MGEIDKTKWMMEAGYGVFFHYLYDLQNKAASPWNPGGSTDWDTCVNEFSVPRLVEDVLQTGAGWVVFTVHQNSGYGCAPNSRYDSYCGKDKCSERDLWGEVADSLAKHGIRTIMYASANAPMFDPEAIEGLSYTYGAASPDNYVEFRRRWYEIIEEYARRYGSLLSGWWIDGCGDTTGAGYLWDDGALAGFAAALRAGNENAIICFNAQNMHPDSLNVHNGIVHSWNTVEDYTAGEAFILGSLPESRFIGPQQWHMTTYMGNDWARPEVRFADQVWIDFMRQVFAKQGTISLDMTLRRDGSINPPQLEQMKAIRKAFRDA